MRDMTNPGGRRVRRPTVYRPRRAGGMTEARLTHLAGPAISARGGSSGVVRAPATARRPTRVGRVAKEAGKAVHYECVLACSASCPRYAADWQCVRCGPRVAPEAPAE